MARNRMTIEKHQRDSKKKRKAEEKREARRIRKSQKTSAPGPTASDESGLPLQLESEEVAERDGEEQHQIQEE